jgi:hypothetical protein
LVELANTNLRQLVLDELSPLLPKRWRLSPVALTDVPQQISVEVILQSIERWALSPQDYRLLTYTVNVVAPGPSDDVIDNAIVTLMNAIDQSQTLQAPRAERATWTLGSAELPCYTITVQLAFEKE